MPSPPLRALLAPAAVAACALVACGSAVPISGATPTPACATPEGTPETDSFTQQVPLTTGAGGLRFGDIRVGCGAAVHSGQIVTVEYTGWLSNGQEFDSSRTAGRQPFAFPLGQQQVIPGFEQGVMGMHIGGKRRLEIPPALGYGPQGVPPTIPPSATLVFDVEVVSASS